MNKSICLITPPSPFLLNERVFIHIGILKVASVLERANYQVDFLDLSGIENYLSVIEDYMLASNVTTYGLTATTPQIQFAVKIVKMIRKMRPKSKVILGGPHVTLMHSASKREKNNINIGNRRASQDIDKLKEIFDILVCGDGELSIHDALDIDKGIIDADDKNSPLFLKRGTLETFPLPARHLVDISSYHYEIEGRNSTSLIAQLGCPFQCTFCSGRNSPFLRIIRTRSVESIVEELRFLYETYGYTGFMFYDDELNVNKKMMINLMNQIADLQTQLGVDFRLRGFIKSELFSEEQANAMYRAGFRWLLTGFESGDERILKNIKKMATRSDNVRCVQIAKKHGLKIKALMSIGHAGESLESIENTKEWLLEVEPDDFDCTIITTYPGSLYFDNAVKSDGCYVYTSDVSNDKLYQSMIDYLVDLDYYKGDPDGGYVSYVWTDHISAEGLVTARDKLEKEVRAKLGIKFNPAGASSKYEHSMGMGNVCIPKHILRSNRSLNKGNII